MFFMNEEGSEIVNSDYVERFRIIKKPDAVLLIASYGEDRAVTLARYKDEKEAERALYDLLFELSDKENPYTMLASSLRADELHIRHNGKKEKGHGGS